MCMQDCRRVAKKSQRQRAAECHRYICIYVLWIAMSCWGEDAVRLCESYRHPGRSRPWCNLKTVTKCHWAFFVRKVQLQWCYYFPSHQSWGQAKMEAKQTRYKRKTPGDFRKWATRDACGVRGGNSTLHHLTAHSYLRVEHLYWRSMAATRA